MKLPFPPPENAAEELLMMMMQFQRKLIRPSESLTRPMLSPTQFQALGTLIFGGPLSMSELATELMVSKQQLTPVIDKLEKMGLVLRSGDATDRRVIRLELSPKGLVYLEGMKKEFVQMVETKLAVLDAGSRADLRSALGTVGRILNQLP